jgi:4-amino-4-deoxy-L-arabinose transferase-like glycosyltransferase
VATAYGLALRLARDRGAAFFAGLLFGLHPLQVEGVAWISALSDPLSGLFALLALYAFVRWRERGSRGVPALAALAFGLALLAKEAAVAVLPLALVIDVLRPRDDLPAGRRRLLRPIAAPARAWAPSPRCCSSTTWRASRSSASPRRASSASRPTSASAPAGSRCCAHGFR